jgi:hypothetical protein
MCIGALFASLTQAKDTLHVMHITSQYLSPVRKRNLPMTVQFAVDMINNNSDILDFDLKVHLQVTGLVSYAT